jgi:hypothetical protein
MRQHHWAIASLFVIMISAAAPGRAQDVTVPRFSFKEPNRSFDPRRTIVVSIRGFNREQHRNLRARLFFQRRDYLIGHPFNHAQRCLVYDDFVLESSSLTITDAGIELNDLAAVLPERALFCVVVFEEGNWEPGPLMIEPEAVKEYFRRGFQFALQPTGRASATLRLAASHKVSREEHSAERIAVAKNREVTAKLASDNAVCIHFRSRSDRNLVARGAQPPMPLLAAIGQSPFSEVWDGAFLLASFMAK